MIYQLIQKGNNCKEHDIVREECMPCKSWMNEMTDWLEKGYGRWHRRKDNSLYIVCLRCGKVKDINNYRGVRTRKFCSRSCAYHALIEYELM